MDDNTQASQLAAKIRCDALAWPACQIGTASRAAIYNRMCKNIDRLAVLSAQAAPAAQATPIPIEINGLESINEVQQATNQTPSSEAEPAEKEIDALVNESREKEWTSIQFVREAVRRFKSPSSEARDAWIDYEKTRPTGLARRVLVDSSWGVREAYWVARYSNFQDVQTGSDEGMYAERYAGGFVVRAWREHPAALAREQAK